MECVLAILVIPEVICVGHAHLPTTHSSRLLARDTRGNIRLIILKFNLLFTTTWRLQALVSCAVRLVFSGRAAAWDGTDAEIKTNHH
jgi:hypothetical protein